MEKKITFNELSGSLKTLVVFGWFVFGLYAFAFLLLVLGIMLGIE